MQTSSYWRRGCVSVALAAFAVSSCSATTVSVVSLTDLDCASCSDDAVKVVEKMAGVKEAQFDIARAEITIEHDPAVAAAMLRERLYDAGYDAVVGAGKGSYLRGPEFPPGVDVRWLTRDGQYVDIGDHLASGKVTVFDYGAAWCSPCRAVDKEMVRLLRERSDIALRKLDVASWDSPLAQRALRGVKALPHLRVFDAAGREVDRITGLDLPRLRAAIKTAAGHREHAP